MPQIDQAPGVAIKGYAWLPDLRRRAHGRPVRVRLTGRWAIGISGPDAAAFFYGGGNLERHTALPHPS
jgi:fatty-acid peroxygenase